MEKNKTGKKRIVDGLFVSNSIQDLSIIGSTLNEIHFGLALPTKEKKYIRKLLSQLFYPIDFIRHINSISTGREDKVKGIS